MNVGIDVGGTKISIALVDEGEMQSQLRRFLVRECVDADAVVKKMHLSISELLDQHSLTWNDIDHIGIGAPGPLDYKSGVILHTPNLVMVRNYPLAPRLSERAGCPVYLNNDANCFVLGEQRAGEARGVEHALGITLGTGFGLGFVYRGEIYNGATGTGMEFAMTPYRDGVYEDYVSGRGLSMIYRELADRTANGEEIFQLAEQNDSAALEAWKAFGTHIAHALIGLVNVLDPDCIVIGGSVAEGFRFFFTSLEQELRAGIHDRPRQHLCIRKSQLGEKAAIIGAASLEY